MRTLRVSSVTPWFCADCARRGFHRALRVLRPGFRSPYGALIPHPGEPGLRYCPRCDGPLSSYGCINPEVDEGGEPA